MRFIEDRIARLLASVVLGCSILSGAAAAGEAVSRAPAHAHCDALRIGTTIFVWGRVVAAGPATDTYLVCHVYVDGSPVGVVPGVGVGLTAQAVGAMQSGPFGITSACAEVHVTYVDGDWRQYC